MPKKKNNGGRKPVDPNERVILVGFYTKKSTVDCVGGMDQARTLAKEYIESVARI